MTDDGTTPTAATRRVTVPEVRARKRSRGDLPLVMLTAYDTPGARIADAAGVDIDPCGRLAGQRRARPRRHAAGGRGGHGPPRRGRGPGRRRGPWWWGTCPGSATTSRPRTPCATPPSSSAPAPRRSSSRAAGPGLAVVEALLNAEIPVMGHLGLTPQSVHAMGGYQVQARDTAAAEALMNDAKALSAAGCFAMVLEGVPDVVAARVTAEVDVPTIGIGAGAGCDGQVLVFHDLLGLREGAAAEVRAPVRGSHRGGGGGGVVVGRRRAWRDLPLRGRDLPPPRRALIGRSRPAEGPTGRPEEARSRRLPWPRPRTG